MNGRLAWPTGGFAQRVAIVGLCAGAYWAVHVGMADDRVAACLIVNPRAFVFYDGMDAVRDMRRALAEPLTMQRVRHNVTRARVARALRLLATLPARRLARFRGGTPSFDYGTELDALVDRMRDSAPPLTLVFTAREPLDEELHERGQLERMADWPSFTLSRSCGPRPHSAADLGPATGSRDPRARDIRAVRTPPERARMTNARDNGPRTALHYRYDVLGRALILRLLQGGRTGGNPDDRGRRMTGVTVDAARAGTHVCRTSADTSSSRMTARTVGPRSPRRATLEGRSIVPGVAGEPADHGSGRSAGSVVHGRRSAMQTTT